VVRMLRRAMLLISSGSLRKLWCFSDSVRATKGSTEKVCLSAISVRSSLVSGATDPQVRARFTDTSGVALLDASRIAIDHSQYVSEVT
jgi:hypothetical protein